MDANGLTSQRGWKRAELNIWLEIEQIQLQKDINLSLNAWLNPRFIKF